MVIFNILSSNLWGLPSTCILSRMHIWPFIEELHYIESGRTKSPYNETLLLSETPFMNFRREVSSGLSSPRFILALSSPSPFNFPDSISYWRMFSSSLHMNLILLVSFFGLAACLMRGNETDRLALLEFKSLIREDPSAVLSSWNNTVHFCEWHGVTCSPRRQRVTVLNLQSLELAGSISPHIGNLSFLRDLSLLGNEFDGKIPPEIGSLKRLQSLRLYNNSLSGTIPPNLSNCSELTLISLGGNQLVGEIPVNLASLTKLQLLGIQWNYLTGLIPPSIGNLSSLTSLAAARNSLHGSIPESIGRLKNFQSLEVGANNLSGTIPPSVFNLTSLTTLDITENYEIRGNLPANLFNMLPNLNYVSFASNRFTGSIPVSISNASNLMMFQAQANQFSGAMPSLAKLHKIQRLLIWGNQLGTGEADDMDFLSSLVNATGLEMVIMDNNNFGGRLPETLVNLSTNLAYLTLGSNQISGEIPSGIGNLVKMVFLSMQINRISGRIPPSIGKLQGLVRLYLDRNQLTGNLPSSIGNLTLLTDLSLGSNFFQGEIPPSLGMLQTVAFIDVGENNLTGPIPTELFGLSSLSVVLDLSRNNFIGGLPSEVGNLSNLGALDMSENRLSGKIPVTLGTCIRLEQLYMQGNNFQGSIPLSLSSLKALHVLDLSQNNFSGEIPSFLEKLDLLQVLNLSSNNFNGPVPADGVFKNASAISISGNGELCGGSAVLHLPKCTVKEPEKRKSNLTLKLVVSIVSAVVGSSLIALILVLCLIKKRRKHTSSSSFFDKSLLAVSYHSLLKATDGFSESSLLGIGAFGSVYKGTIIDGERRMVVAVKVLNLSKRGATRSFLAECEALRNIRHRNLVKVLTACSGADNSGNDFKAIIYEFMVNGSLEDWLHQTNREGLQETRGVLSLLQRLNIAIDVACALDYLHHHCETPIVHCDLKPSNILLDAEMVAHVGDFGLARFISEATEQHQTNQSSTIGIRGSTGYIAPEYGMGSGVSTLGDAYSYGNLLLELFTGKRPTHEMFNEGLNIHNFAERALSGQLEGIIDPVILEEGQQMDQSSRYHRTQASTSNRTRASTSNRVQECLISILRVGLTCSSEQPKERMDISDAVAELNSIRNKLLQ